jgi:hypothetical protein
MKPLKKHVTLILLCGLALLSNISAQEKLNREVSTYRFEFKLVAKSDSLPTLFCVMSVTDLFNYKKIYLSYNNKTKQYFTQNLLKTTPEDVRFEGYFVYFKINEILNEPFVIMEGEDSRGKRYTIYERNAIGQVINPRVDMDQWNRSYTRIDSMDYVRQFDDVYTGNDGKPRYKDKSGKVYVIEKDHTRLE